MIFNSKQHTISDGFKVLKTEKESFGIATFEVTDRNTGEKKVLQIDVPAEMLASSVCQIRKQLLLNKLFNHNFFISPLPGALETFFHLLLFPDDGVTILSKAPVEDLPDDAEVIIVTSRDDETQGVRREH